MDTFKAIKISKWNLLIYTVIVAGLLHSCDFFNGDNFPVRPSARYPGYWEYRGRPVLLLGGTRNDNLFQEPDAAQHLKELARVGGNYIRNTMSARDSGNVQPFLLLDNGSYDLDQWNPEYWQRFETLLQAARRLNIIVQIDLWDRLDFSQTEWLVNAFNPGINISYTYAESGLDSLYPQHAGQDLQPFFHSIPGLPHYISELEKIRHYQEKYVSKLLDHTLKYPNILYCMNNETNTPVEWGQYWVTFIRSRASAEHHEVYATDIFDANYRPGTCLACLMAAVTPEMYQFLDVSSINSRNFGQAHWDTLQVIMNRVKDFKRPVNTIKVDGGGFTAGGSGTPQDGVERFCRNLVGGMAAARFHKPTSGNGLNEFAQSTIKAIRMAEEYVKFWEIEPAMNLLADRGANEAYAATNGRDKFLVYFPAGGAVTLTTGGVQGIFELIWINVAPGNRVDMTIVQPQGSVKLTTPDSSGWFALVVQR